MNEVKDLRVVIVGMGKSGLAAAQLCLDRGAASVQAVDQRSAEDLGETGLRLQQLGVPLLAQTAESFRGADLVVLSPGVAIDDPQIAAAQGAGLRVVGEVELASWYMRGPIAGITGSNGKTTTTALLGHILRENRVPVQVGGNIGTAPTSMVDSSREDQWNVLELSSFQLESVDCFRARVAIATNVTDNHLDRHHTFENYAAAKGRIFTNQQPGDTAVLNADNPATASYAAQTRAQVTWFSSRRQVDGLYVEGERVLFRGEFLMTTADMPVPGRHNLENAMAAAAAARVAGIPLDGIAAAIRTFPGVEHRIEFVRELRGVRYYNDSKATSVDATLKAIDSFAGGLWIILGGKDKHSDYTVLRAPLQGKARRVLLIGSAATIIERQLEGAAPLEHHGTIDKAVQAAAREAASGDVVLLAPACASFDQFNGFEHRGQVFKELVRGL